VVTSPDPDTLHRVHIRLPSGKVVVVQQPEAQRRRAALQSITGDTRSGGRLQTEATRQSPLSLAGTFVYVRSEVEVVDRHISDIHPISHSEKRVGQGEVRLGTTMELLVLRHSISEIRLAPVVRGHRPVSGTVQGTRVRMRARVVILVPVEAVPVPPEQPQQGVFLQMAGSGSRMPFSERAISGREGEVERVETELEAQAVPEAVEERAETTSRQGLVEAVSTPVPEAAEAHIIHLVETAVQTREAAAAAGPITTSRTRVVTADQVSSSSVLWLKEMAA